MQRIEAAKKIASIMGKSRNRVYLEADTLLLNLTGGVDAHLEKKKWRNSRTLKEWEVQRVTTPSQVKESLAMKFRSNFLPEIPRSYE